MQHAGGGRALTAVEHVGAALVLHGVGIVQARYCHEGLFAKEFNFFRAGLGGAAATAAAIAVAACAGAAARRGGLRQRHIWALEDGIQLSRAVHCTPLTPRCKCATGRGCAAARRDGSGGGGAPATATQAMACVESPEIPASLTEPVAGAFAAPRSGL
jgi:hypothetical protein